MQDCTYTLKHTFGVENKVADALSWHTCVLKQLNAEVVGFERVKESTCYAPILERFLVLWSKGDTGDRWFPTPGLSILISHVMHSPYLTMRLSCLGTACFGSCWSLRPRKNHKCGGKFVLLAKPKKRCCEADMAMSHLPIGQAVKTEHWHVYASTRARVPW